MQSNSSSGLSRMRIAVRFKLARHAGAAEVGGEPVVSAMGGEAVFERRAQLAGNLL